MWLYLPIFGSRYCTYASEAQRKFEKKLQMKWHVDAVLVLNGLRHASKECTFVHYFRICFITNEVAHSEIPWKPAIRLTFISQKKNEDLNKPLNCVMRGARRSIRNRGACLPAELVLSAGKIPVSNVCGSCGRSREIETSRLGLPRRVTSEFSRRIIKGERLG